MDFHQLISDIFNIHDSIFQHAIRNARGSSRLPIFSRQAPGHIGVDTIDVPNINLDYNLFPEDLKDKIVAIFSSGEIVKKYPFQSEGIHPGVIESFLNGIRNIYHLSIAEDPLNRYHAFQLYALDHSKCIAEWFEHGTTSRFIQVTIQPEIYVGDFKCFNQWLSYSPSLAELCIEGYKGSLSEQEAAERVFASSFLRRDMNTMPISADDILAETDILVLSLWRALGIVYRIQDIRFERQPWQYSPDVYLPFGLNPQPYWDNPRENFAIQTFTKINTRIYDSFLHQLTKDQYDRIIRWMNFLSANREAVYSLNLINDGFRDIARSVIEQSFRKHKIARDGIFKAISGLEGLVYTCKPSHPKYGYKWKSNETFVDCWGAIWRKALLNDQKDLPLLRATDIDIALREIYSLRSYLAHSDPTSLQASLMQVKKSCGDLFNPNEYSPSDVGMTILTVIDELLEFLFVNDKVFRNLLNGIKPS